MQTKVHLSLTPQASAFLRARATSSASFSIPMVLAPVNKATVLTPAAEQPIDLVAGALSALTLLFETLGPLAVDDHLVLAALLWEATLPAAVGEAARRAPPSPTDDNPRPEINPNHNPTTIASSY